MSQLFSGTMINVDLTQAPNEIPLIDPGVYNLEVKTVNIEENNDHTGFNLVVDFEIASDGPNKGRSVRDYISLSSDSKKNVRLRRFILATMGTIDKSGTDVNATVGKVASVEIVQRPSSKDKTKIYSNIKDYILSPEVLAANPTAAS